MKLLWLLVLIYTANLCLGNSTPSKEWWQTAVIYQIYPRSFKDSDGDGIGDLKGITEKLGHLKEAGVDAVWLSPIFLSPMYDFGYDIADFKKIQPEYGTMDDFDELLSNAKKLGLAVILDFVPNHSSNESEWFQLSANRTKGYENYFVWADGKPDPANSEKLLPPSNWVSFFRKSAWELNKQRGQFYLHQFTIGQPDLNYRDPAVVEEMKSVLRFWLDKGVNGFRVDIIPTLFEVDLRKHGGKFPDEPRSDSIDLTPDDHGYLKHIYTMNQDETYDMVYQWRQLLDEYTAKDGIPRLMLTEAYEEVSLVMRYFGNGTHKGAQLPFNFEFLKNINKDSKAGDIKFTIDKWMSNMPEGMVPNWVNGNHDNSRVASRNGVEKADGLNMLALLLPGVALTYQGEELAMTDGYVSWKDTVDPQACNTDDPINYYKSSRDPARTPFQWDDSLNAGFSTGARTWLPVASNYKDLNLKNQKNSVKSHYKLYKDLTNLRRTIPVMDGKLDIKALSDDVLAITRSLPNHEAVVGVLNLSKNVQVVDLGVFEYLTAELIVYTSSLNSLLQKGTTVDTKRVILSPYDAVVFTSKGKIN